MRILVTGATGNVGRHIVAQLHAAGHEVRALSRNPAKAGLPAGVEVVAGDLTDISTLGPALEGVDAIHLITFGGDADLTNGPEIVDLVARHGITRATVLCGWSPTSVESALESSAIRWTFLQLAEFMGNALEWADEIRSHGTVSTLATFRSVVVHEADIAAVAVAALTQDGHEGRTYLITGPQALTPAERTQIIAEAIGQDLTFVHLNEEQERARLRGFGYDEDYVEFGIRLAMSPPGVSDVVHPTVEEVTGRPARTFAQWAREHADHFRPTS
ncbi:NAD(P)H-binding protein [Nonomuraea sp. NPDC050328]|uniref:NAD(P)H-binding protein n=1 Tax=Nonomuraea sp. NPDC050328 TaxID=3364361 RepID=UPI00378E439D